MIGGRLAKGLAVLAVLALLSLAATGCTSTLQQLVGVNQGEGTQWSKGGRESAVPLSDESANFNKSEGNRVFTIVKRSPEFKEIQPRLLRLQPTGTMQLGKGLIGVTFDLKLEQEYCSRSSDIQIYPYVIFIIDIAQEKTIEVVTGTPDLSSMEVELKFSRAPQNNKREKISPDVIKKLEQARKRFQERKKQMQSEMIVVPERICDETLEYPRTYCSCDEIVPGHLDSNCFSACTLACSFISNPVLRAGCGAACYGGCYVPAYCVQITCMTVYPC